MKKVIYFAVVLLLTAVVFSTSAKANPTSTFPTCNDCVTRTAPSGLGDLVHGNFYTWKMTGLSIPSGESITKASLTFYNINDWKIEDGDKLYIRLLSGSDITNANTTLGMSTINSTLNRGNDTLPNADDLGNYGHPLTIYEDKNEYSHSYTETYWVRERQNGHLVWVEKTVTKTEWVNPPETFTWEFTSEQIGYLSGYIADGGVVGIGLDADCYYRIPETTDCGIKFKYCTEPTPTIPTPSAVLLGSIGVTLVGWLRRTRTL